MIVECSYCEAKVDGRVVAQHIDPPGPEGLEPYRVSLLACPICGNGLIAGECEIGYDNDAVVWDAPTRLWPCPDKRVPWYVPRIVGASLEEANRCFKAGAHSACAVMCGRSLEGICKHYETKSNNLIGGLKELLEKGVIDKRLLEWSEALRHSRNLGAHITDQVVSKEDARDLLDFANAIVEYVFVLTRQFEKFIARRGESEKKKARKKK
jgi:hypothetical protein